MQLLRKLLFPFSVLYHIITAIRNYFFDCGLLKSTAFELPIIAIGNLSVGGTGKTPMTEYLIRLLQDEYRLAVLSRGYGRKTKGYVLGNSNSDALTLGDEPFQFYKKFPKINVAVQEKRVLGVQNLIRDKNPEVILLDDAYQHRAIKAGFYILLTAFGDLYSDDYLLPSGNLREYQTGADRANIVIVTKCPGNLSDVEQGKIAEKLQLKSHQKLFFTTIAYDENAYSEKDSMSVETLKETDKVIVSGIANPTLFQKHVGRENDIFLNFGDHHNFSNDDIVNIRQSGTNKPIVTTEKDYGRLQPLLKDDNLYYLPIRAKFLKNEAEFDELIQNYIKKSIEKLG